MPATGLELKIHLCNHMNIVVSKLAAKKNTMAEAETRQSTVKCSVWLEKSSHRLIPSHQTGAPAAPS